MRIFFLKSNCISDFQIENFQECFLPKFNLPNDILIKEFCPQSNSLDSQNIEKFDSSKKNLSTT